MIESAYKGRKLCPFATFGFVFPPIICMFKSLYQIECLSTVNNFQFVQDSTTCRKDGSGEICFLIPQYNFFPTILLNACAYELECFFHGLPAEDVSKNKRSNDGCIAFNDVFGCVDVEFAPGDFFIWNGT